MIGKLGGTLVGWSAEEAGSVIHLGSVLVPR